MRLTDFILCREREDMSAAAGSASGAGGDNSGARGSDYHGVENFTRLHSAQLTAMGLPPSLWSTVHRKIYNEIFDAVRMILALHAQSGAAVLMLRWLWCADRFVSRRIRRRNWVSGCL